MPELTASLSFTWPDGQVVFDRLDVDLPQGRSGLVGANGAGKSPLLRLLAGEITPTQGSVHPGGRLGYPPQDLTLATDVRVDVHLGIAAKRRALKAITAGDVAQRHFDAIGDDWDVEARAEALLDRLGLPTGVLDRHLGQLSGSELTQLGLTRVLLDRPDILLLDEPTNNLDRAARLRLYDVVEDLRGIVLVVSHDRELLERVERIAELHAGQIHWYGGNLASYEDQLRAEQAARQRSRQESSPASLRAG